MIDPVALAILVPFAGACAAFILRTRAMPVGIVTAVATTMTSALVVRDVWIDGPRRVELAGWGAPLGIDLVADGLAAAMLLTTAGIGAAVAAYATGTFHHEGEPSWEPRSSFWPLYLFLWAGLDALFLSADVFNLYVALEAVTLSAVALVLLEGGGEVFRAGMRYLLMAFGGSLAYLLGVALIYSRFGALDLYLIEGDDAAMTTALVLMTVALMVKAGMFPLHLWLPMAHAEAPSAVSPVLSGIVVKVGIYLVVRLWFDGLPDAAWGVGAQVIGVLAAIAIVWASVTAFRQPSLKLLIAYSTVAQMGYLFLVLPLAFPLDGEPRSGVGGEAWAGASAYVVAHGLCKAALFMSAGLLKHARGSDAFDTLRGSLRTSPVLVAAFVAAAIALIGVPGLGVSQAKDELSSAAAEAGWWWEALIYGGTALTIAYLARAAIGMVRPWSPESPGKDQPVGLIPQAATVTVAVAALAIGAGTDGLLELLRIGSPLGEPAG